MRSLAKRLCFFARGGDGFLAGMSWIPEGIGADEVVDRGEQFAHASHDGDFFEFAGFDEAIVECLDGWIAARCGAGSHIKHIAYTHPTAADFAFASELSTVVVVRRQASQRGDLFTIQMTKFRQVGQQCGRNNRADSGDAVHDFGGCVPLFVGLQQFLNFLFDLPDLLIQYADDLLDILVDRP